MSEHYGEDLAAVHDAGFSAGATIAGRTLLRELDAAGHRSGVVVDLGCGAGQLSEVAAAAGYDVVGVDLSPAMVERARRRVPGARFEVAAFLDFALPECVAVTAIGEVINYLHDTDVTRPALRRLWRRIHRALAPRGVFLLDVLGPGAVPGGRRQTFRGDHDWVVLADIREQERRLTREIVTFRRDGDAWRRSDEVHEQHLIEPGTVATELRDAGFRVVGRRAWEGAEPRPGHRALIARKA